MIQTTRISKGAYLYGRFFGAFAAVALCYMSIALGTLAGFSRAELDAKLQGLLEETQNPGNLFSIRGMARLMFD